MTLFPGREVSGADPQRNCVMEESRTWGWGPWFHARTQLLPLCPSPFPALHFPPPWVCPNAPPETYSLTDHWGFSPLHKGPAGL